MRKALMGLILAATVMTPIAAEAQDWHNRDRGGRGARSQNENDGNGDGRAARAERRQERQEAQPAPQPQVQQQQQQQVQVVERQRGDGGSRYRGGDGNRGDRGDRNRGDNGSRGNWRGGNNNQGSIYPQAWQGDPNSPQLRHYQELERRNQQSYGNQRYEGRRNDRNWRGDRTNRRNDWNRSWRDNNRYDWQRWRYSNRNIFRIGPYYSPYRGYGYNRFDIGFFLEPLFFGRNYWLGDPWQYRLPPAPPGTQWVRYYNDVLLVDVYSGEVIDAIYDFFW
ncbi:MAG TPA: RcnB family protein [Allosphingosinicella sp.]|nr:RcnB family protein [Allosphingosinicella sp.]